jgi:hypothetical protein
MMLIICYDLLYAYDLLWFAICLCSGMICYMLMFWYDLLYAWSMMLMICYGLLYAYVLV